MSMAVVSKHQSSERTITAARWVADNAFDSDGRVRFGFDESTLHRACAVLIRDGEWPGDDSERVSRLQAALFRV